MSEYPNTDPANGQGQYNPANFEGIPGYGAGAASADEGTVYGATIPGGDSANQAPPPGPDVPPPVPPSQEDFHPPGGTYPNRFKAAPPPVYPEPPTVPPPPPIYQGDPAAAAPQPEKKGRRVGTITLAVCLIFVGVVLVLRIFLPNLNYVLIAQLSPLILVLLGVEILIANIRHKDEKLRYDGLSFFICIVVTGAALILATVPAFFESQINSGFTARRLAAEMEDKTSAYMQDDWNGMYTVDWYMELNGTHFNKDMSLADIAPEQYVQMRIHFDEEFESTEAFAAACYGVIEDVSPDVPHIDYASFYSEGDDADGYHGDKIYFLVIENRYNFDTTAANLANHVEAQYWLPEENIYIGQWEYEDRQNNPEKYTDPEDPPADIDETEDPEEWEEPEEIDDLSVTDAQGLNSAAGQVLFSYPVAV